MQREPAHRPPAANERLWPFAPFVAYVAAHLGIPVHPTNGPCPGCHGAPARTSDHPVCLTALALARHIGRDPNQIHRWHQIGLTDTQADHLAVAAGTLPSRIWGDSWRQAGLTVLDDLYLHGTPTAEPGWRHAAGYQPPHTRTHPGTTTAA